MFAYSTESFPTLHYTALAQHSTSGGPNLGLVARRRAQKTKQCHPPPQATLLLEDYENDDGDDDGDGYDDDDNDGFQ